MGLISEVKKIAKKFGCRAILLYGNPAFYLKRGFEPAEKYGIRNSENMFADALHVYGLFAGALDGITGKYYENDVYYADEGEVKAFDKDFPFKEVVSGTPSQHIFLKYPLNAGRLKNSRSFSFYPVRSADEKNDSAA